MPRLDPIFDAVPALLDEAAERFVLPRFRTLADSEIEEKSRGELVTVADREAEAFLSPRLAALLPGSRVVGEEATAANPALLHGLDEGDVWVVDPLDGTANFVAGRPRFAMMAALLRRGEAVGAWVLLPLAGERWRAEQGAGTWRDGARVLVPRAPTPADALRGAVMTRFLPAELRDAVEVRRGRLGEPVTAYGSAGADYPDLISGAKHYTLYWRTLPWDHAPGTLMLAEAGGHAARLDGRSWRAGDGLTGLLVASDRQAWQTVRDALFVP